jgi:hypothetical protein
LHPAAWVAAGNAERGTVDWQFTKEDARQRLHWLYPHPHQDSFTVSRHSGRHQIGTDD